MPMCVYCMSSLHEMGAPLNQILDMNGSHCYTCPKSGNINCSVCKQQLNMRETLTEDKQNGGMRHYSCDQHDPSAPKEYVPDPNRSAKSNQFGKLLFEKIDY